MIEEYMAREMEAMEFLFEETKGEEFYRELVRLREPGLMDERRWRLLHGGPSLLLIPA
jgi:hypothetical protein